MAKVVLQTQKIFLINPKRFDWPGLKHERFEELVKNYGMLCVNIPAIESRRTHSVVAECRPSGLPHLLYRKVNLFQAAIYSACVDLETTPRHLDLENNAHRETIISWMSEAAHFTDYLVEQMEEHKPACIVYLQGYFHDTSVARQLAINRNIKLCAFEITFNKEKLVWESVSGLSVNKTLAKNFYWRYKDTVPVAEVEEWYKNFVDSYKQNKHSDHISKEGTFSFPPKKVITYIGQVLTDSSTMFGLAGGFTDQVEIIHWLKDYVEEKGYFLFVKLHPKESSGRNPVNHALLDQLTWRKLQPWANSSAAFVDNENLFDTNDVIENSNVLVTINSQAGLEGAMQKKHVILCGEAFFGGLEFTYDVQSPKTLAAALDEVIERDPPSFSSFEVAKFVYIYFTKYCIGRSESELAVKVRDLIQL